MKTIIQSPHVKISEKMESIIKHKLERLGKIFDRIELCNIVLKKEKNGKGDDFIVEAKLSVPGNDLFAKDQAETYEIAAEKVCVNLESQIRKHKAKLTKKAILPGDQFIKDEELE